MNIFKKSLDRRDRLLKKHGIEFNAPLDRIRVRHTPMGGLLLRGDRKPLYPIDQNKATITLLKGKYRKCIVRDFHLMTPIENE